MKAASAQRQPGEPAKGGSRKGGKGSGKRSPFVFVVFSVPYRRDEWMGIFTVWSLGG
jgi:hypothetical protein